MATAAIGLAASVSCGGDQGAEDESSRTTPVLGQGLPQEIRHPITSAIERLQRAFVAKDYASICAGLTRAAARAAGEAAHGDATRCVPDVRRFLGMIRDGGGWRHGGEPRVIDVDAQGSRATATVALDKRWQATVPLARRNGRWLLAGFFGYPEHRAYRAAAEIPNRPFPASGSRQTRATRNDGSPCPPLSTAQYPTISGGCLVKVEGALMPLTVLTPFGYFVFERCRLAYRVRVAENGATWLEDLQAPGPPDSACGDVDSCYDFTQEAFSPLKGRIRATKSDAFVHTTDMCLRTCVGFFIGELRLRLVRDDSGWRAEPIAGGGRSGFRFHHPLTLKGDFDLATAA